MHFKNGRRAGNGAYSQKETSSMVVVVVVFNRPEVNFRPDGGTSPGNYGWLFVEAQNGFRTNKSTDTASQNFVERIQEALDRGLHAIALFFYLSKAYYVIYHDILLEK
jgi:hypothetical protein